MQNTVKWNVPRALNGPWELRCRRCWAIVTLPARVWINVEVESSIITWVVRPVSLVYWHFSYFFGLQLGKPQKMCFPWKGLPRSWKTIIKDVWSNLAGIYKIPSCVFQGWRWSARLALSPCWRGTFSCGPSYLDHPLNPRWSMFIFVLQWGSNCDTLTAPRIHRTRVSKRPDQSLPNLATGVPALGNI